MDAADLRPLSSTRKVRFPPRKPPRREVKHPQVRREADQEEEEEECADDNDKTMALRELAKKHLTRRQSKVEKKSEVEFAHGDAPSTPMRTLQADKGLKLSGSDDDAPVEILEKDPSFEKKKKKKKKKKKDYIEPWDYDRSYYPTCLPLRKPHSGDPELLDKEECGSATSTGEYDESTVNSALELGLLEKVDDATTKMIVFQIPANIMSSSAANKVQAGCLGKLLMYKSGDVKLKLGDILFDVSTDCDGIFAQDVMMINTKAKQCCAAEDPNNNNKWAIVSADVDSFL